MEINALNKISWEIKDNGQNDDYCSIYNPNAIYTLDSGSSTFIDKEELITRFIDVSLKRIEWACNYDCISRDDLIWRVHEDERYPNIYSFQVMDKKYNEEWECESRTIAELIINNNEKVFHEVELKPIKQLIS